MSHVYEYRITQTIEVPIIRERRHDGTVRVLTDRELLDELSAFAAEHIRRSDLDVEYIGAHAKHVEYETPDGEPYDILEVDGLEPLGYYDTELSDPRPNRRASPARIFLMRIASTARYNPDEGYDWRFMKGAQLSWGVRGSMSAEVIDEWDE